jgi:hypothetical protein
MASPTPQELFGSNYTANQSSITVSLADLLPAGELTAAEANATTGNGVKVAYALVKTFSEKLAALSETPTRVSSFEGSYSTNADGTVSRTYTQTFEFSVGDIADEPDVSSPSSSDSSYASGSSSPSGS